MTPTARLSAAVEVLVAIDRDRKPAAAVLKDWGTTHRFAGSGDRAAIAGLVYDVLRRQSSSAWIMGADTPRARLLGEAHSLARRIAANAPLTVKACHELVYLSTEMGRSAALRAGHKLFEPVYASADAQEGPLAFAQKRPPQWRGL